MPISTRPGSAVDNVARFQAFMALTLQAMFLLGSTVFVVRNIGNAFVVGVGAVSAVVGFWLVFTGRRGRYVVGWVLLVGGTLVAVSSVFLLIKDEPRARIGLVMLGVVAAASLGVVGRLRHRHGSRVLAAQIATAADLAEPEFSPAPRLHHPWLLVNPHSGGGRAEQAGLTAAARDLGIDVHELTHGDDVEALARAAVAAGADAIGSAGGDGSLGAVVKVAIEHDLPFVHVPAGTRCHFAQDLGLDRDDLVGALRAFTEGEERRIDVATIGERVFCNNASFGLYGAMVAEPGYRDAKVQTARAVLAELVNGERQPFSLRVAEPDGHDVERAVLVLVGVNAYDTVRIDELGTRKSLDGGRLQVSVLESIDGPTVASLLAGIALGAAPSRPDSVTRRGALVQWETTGVVIGSDDTVLDVGVDGEFERYDTPVALKILPKALRVLVPPGSGRIPTSLAGKVGVGALWNIATGAPASSAAPTTAPQIEPADEPADDDAEEAP